MLYGPPARARAVLLSMSLRHTVLTGLRWTVAAKFVAQLVTWSVTFYVLRLLTPADYGLMAMAMVLIGVLSLLNEMGLGSALVQRESVDRQLLRQAFGLLLLVNLGLFALILMTAPVVAGFYDEPRLIVMIGVLGAQFLIMPFEVIPQSQLLRAMRFRQLSLTEIAALLVGSAVTLYGALQGQGVWSLIWGSLANRLCRAVLLNLLVPFAQWPSFSLSGMRSLLTFGGFVTVNQLLWYAYSQLDVLLVGRLLGPVVLGHFSVARELAALPMNKLNGILNQVSFPAFASLQRDPVLAARYLRKAIRLVSLFAFPVFFGMSGVAHKAVPLLLGEQWLPAALPIAILSLVMPIRMVSNLFPTILMGMGRADIVFGNLLAATLIMTLTILTGIGWGLTGVSIAWLIGFPLAFLIEITRSRRITTIGLADVIDEMKQPALAGVVMWLVVTWLGSLGDQSLGIVALLGQIGAGVLVFTAMSWALNRSGIDELLSLLRPQRA